MLYLNYWKKEKCKECNSEENQYTVKILAGMRTMISGVGEAREQEENFYKLLISNDASL